MELPSEYVTANGQSRRDGKALLQEFIPRMKWNDQEMVLDVGCGPGDVTRDVTLPLLPSSSCHLVGVDVSKAMVDFASQNFPHNSIEYLVFDIGTKQNPREKFPNGFSKIFSFYCLHWVSDYFTWMKNVFSLLRPSGDALLMFPGDIALMRPYEPMSRKPEWAPYMTDVSDFLSVFFKEKSPELLLAHTAREAGFEVLSCEEVEKTYDFKTVDNLRQQERFIEDCLEWIRAENKKTLGSETMERYKLLVAHLRKPM